MATTTMTTLLCLLGETIEEIENDSRCEERRKKNQTHTMSANSSSMWWECRSGSLNLNFFRDRREREEVQVIHCFICCRHLSPLKWEWKRERDCKMAAKGSENLLASEYKFNSIKTASCQWCVACCHSSSRPFKIEWHRCFYFFFPTICSSLLVKQY